MLCFVTFNKSIPCHCNDNNNNNNNNNYNGNDVSSFITQVIIIMIWLIIQIICTCIL